MFLAGLEHETHMTVRMFNHYTIVHASRLAKLHEAAKASINEHGGLNHANLNMGMVHNTSAV